MDGVKLLDQARAAGLAVVVRGEMLVVRGPRRAEPVARMLLANKPVDLAALANPILPAEWPARHAHALARWRARHPADEADKIAWGELQNLWHKHHGVRIVASICAGCLKPIGTGELLQLGDGTRVHLATLNCLAVYGERWRRDASAALMALGLIPPDA